MKYLQLERPVTKASLYLSIKEYYQDHTDIGAVIQSSLDMVEECIDLKEASNRINHNEGQECIKAFTEIIRKPLIVNLAFYGFGAEAKRRGEI